jgi:hypothetical protein
MVKSKPTPKSQRWYDQHYWSLLLALTALLVAYLIGSRSLDTGSWQQYGLTFLCLFFSLNRLGHAAHTAAKSIWTKRKD